MREYSLALTAANWTSGVAGHTVIVRPEQSADVPAVRQANVAAFGSSVEADLVDTLRTRAQPLVSLVAEHNGEIVGHMLRRPSSLRLSGVNYLDRSATIILAGVMGFGSVTSSG